MRTILRIALAFAIVTISACRQSPQPPPKHAVSAPCQVAEAFLRQWPIAHGAETFLFSNEPQLDVQGFEPREWWRYRATDSEIVPPPPNALLEAAERQARISAGTNCPTVRALLAKRHIPMEQPTAKDEPPQPLLQNDLWQSTFIKVSMPAVSADGTTAVLVASAVSGPEAGSGFLYLLKRHPSNGWQIIGTAGLWIS